MYGNCTDCTTTTTTTPASGFIPTTKLMTHARTSHHSKVSLLTPSYAALKAEIKWGFHCHSYGFACLFFVLAFYTFFSLLNLRTLITSKPYMSSINSFLCLLGTSRALCLLIDPYNVKETMPKILATVFWDIGFPCITSAFCLIQLVFLQLTQLKFGPGKFRQKSSMSVIVAAHFSLVIAADILTAFNENLLITKYVIQAVFLTWGVALFSTFLYTGYRVMALLRRMPRSFLQRETPNPQEKGIMQLAMLAPYSNLAESVAAALMPTLLTPRIRITDENDQTFSFGSDSNSNLQIKSNTLDEEAAQKAKEIYYKPSQSPSAASVRLGSPDPRRKATNTLPTVHLRPPTPVSALPNITISPSSRRSSTVSHHGNEIISRRDSNISYHEELSPSRRGSEVCSRRGSETLSRRGSELSTHSNGEYSRRGSEFSRRGSECSRRGSEFGQKEESECNKYLGGDLCRHGSSSSRRSSDCGSLMEIAEEETLPQNLCGPSLTNQQNLGDSSKGASVKRKRVSHAADISSEDETTVETSLLPQEEKRKVTTEKENDLTLHSILNHIAYVNRAALNSNNIQASNNRKSQVWKVLNIVYGTAIFGSILCGMDMYRLYGPYGISAVSVNTTIANMMKNNADTGDNLTLDTAVGRPRPWPWFLFQTFSRLLEFLMACAMANITKQPVNSRHEYAYPYGYSLHLKRDSMYM